MVPANWRDEECERSFRNRDRRIGKHADEGQVPIFIVEVEAVADDEFIRDFEPREIWLERHDLSADFPQEDARSYGRRPAFLHMLVDHTDRPAGIENIVEQQNVPIRDGRQARIVESHDSRTLRALIARGFEQSNLNRQIQSADEIGEKNERTREDTHDGHFLARIQFGDFNRKLIDTFGNLIRCDQDVHPMLRIIVLSP